MNSWSYTRVTTPITLGIALTDFFLDQVIANQIANRFRAVLVTHAADAEIECGQ